MSIQYLKKDFKSIINKFKYIDSWFWCKYSINPYNGCEFACTYCDSRSHKYHLQAEFDQTIFVKENVKELLDNRLTRARTLLPDIISISGTCDPYQPAEEKFQNTRKCLEVLAKHKFPVGICTKSTLVTRDIDLLHKIANNNWCSVTLTITTIDRDLARILEPGSPSPQQRLETISILKKAGLTQVGVNFMPIVPFLCDSDENLENVTKAVKSAGADYILFAGMTLRDNQARWLIDCLNNKCPEVVPKMLKLYNGTYSDIIGYKGRYSPPNNYYNRLMKRAYAFCEKYDIKYRMKRFIPNDFRKFNYILSEKFLNEAFDSQYRGKPWKNLHWAGQNIQNLKESILDVAGRGELKEIRNVDKELENRIYKYLSDQKISQQIILPKE
jgi:DNA repair photolyase